MKRGEKRRGKAGGKCVHSLKRLEAFKGSLMWLFSTDGSPSSAPSLTVDEAREVSSLLVSPAIDVLSFLDATLWEGAHHSLGQLIKLAVVAALSMNEDVSTCKQSEIMHSIIKLHTRSHGITTNRGSVVDQQNRSCSLCDSLL